MKLTMPMIAAVVLIGLAMPMSARGEDDDCATVINSLNEAVDIGNKNFETTLDELKKLSRAGDAKTKAAVKNKFCSTSGELLGVVRAVRAVAGACGPDQKAALASLDKSIEQTETAIDTTCQ